MGHTFLHSLAHISGKTDKIFTKRLFRQGSHSCPDPGPNRIRLDGGLQSPSALVNYAFMLSQTRGDDDWCSTSWDAASEADASSQRLAWRRRSITICQSQCYNDVLTRLQSALHSVVLLTSESLRYASSYSIVVNH